MARRVPPIKMILLWVIVLAVVVAWITTQDEEWSEMARAFLRHVARRLF